MTYGFALITGGTTGIGAAFAKLLPKSTNLLLVARNEEKLAERKAELETPTARWKPSPPICPPWMAGPR